MYTKSIPFKDFKGKPRNQEVQFNLEIREVIKLFNELYTIFNWLDNVKGDERELQTEEVVEFYNAFEAVLLEAWGVLSEDGLHFRKGGRYEFEESKLFAACMEMYVTQPEETGKLLEGIMPEGMEAMIKKAEGNIDEMAKNPDTDADLRRQLEAAQAKLAEAGVKSD